MLNRNKLIGCFFAFVLICTSFVANNLTYNKDGVMKFQLYKPNLNVPCANFNPTPPYDCVDLF